MKILSCPTCGHIFYAASGALVRLAYCLICCEWVQPIYAGEYDG